MEQEELQKIAERKYGRMQNTGRKNIRKMKVGQVKNFIRRPPGQALSPEEIKWLLKAAYMGAMGTGSTCIMQPMRMEGIPDAHHGVSRCNWVRKTKHSTLTGFMNGCALSTRESLTKR